MASVATSSVRAGGGQCGGQGVGTGLKRRRAKGILRLKRRVRTYYRGVLVAVCMGLCVLALVYRVSNDAGRHSRNSRSGARQGEGLLRRGRPARDALDLPTDTRRLTGNLTLLPVCNPGNYPGEMFTWEQKKQGAVVLYIVGVLYMFVALAIVCDEFFVPALERIVDVCAISDDVAGATFMAAGGSAPELFTSFMGVFASGSDVGFGTIIGSAVFNVLFVIGMCALFSKEILALTWWPLFRDCTYYLISLSTLAVFFGAEYGAGKNHIEWWESLVLFFLYMGYVTVMKFNVQLYEFFRGCSKKERNKAGRRTTVQQGAGDGDGRRRGSLFIRHEDTQDSICEDKEAVMKRAGVTSAFLRPCQFRAGVLHLMLNQTKTSIIARARTFAVADIVGDFRQTFAQIDANGDGSIDRAELEELLQELTGIKPTTNEVDEAWNDMLGSGENSNAGAIDIDKFKVWYAESEARVLKQAHDAFNNIDTDDSGEIDHDELSKVLLNLTKSRNPGMSGSVAADKTEKEVQKVLHTFGHKDEGARDGFSITFDEFVSWYKNSILFEEHKIEIKRQSSLAAGEGDDEEQEPIKLAWPESWGARILFLLTLPILGTLMLTVPDVRNRKYKNLFPISFVMSIVWIGGYSYLMVWWATVIGMTLGIPDTVMGLTFLAAGTSIPDLLTSVIVARQGLGDMAVSSSVGSNIFDILVGLPIPWLTYSAVYAGKPMRVYSESLFISVLTLVGMLAAVVATIAICKWKMSKALGGVMFFLYAVFLASDLIRADWSMSCRTS